MNALHTLLTWMLIFHQKIWIKESSFQTISKIILIYTAICTKQKPSYILDLHEQTSRMVPLVEKQALPN